MALKVRSSNGTKILGEFTVQIPIQEVDSVLECGFRQRWIEAENDDVKISLECGAGLGSSWGVLIVKRGVIERHFRFNAEDLIRAVDEATETTK